MTEQPAASFLRRAAREPLVQFALLASVLFAAGALRERADRQVIRVERVTVAFLIEQQEELLLRPLRADERRDIVEGFLEDEILLREAYARGMDRTPSIRAQLLRAMRFLLAADVPSPTEDDLRALYEETRDEQRTTPSLDFDHVFYADPARVPDDLLASLRAGADHRALGEERLLAGGDMKRTTQAQLVRGLGAESAREILAIEDSSWHGPFRSALGVHYLRIAGRHPARPLSFEESEAYLRALYPVARSRDALEAQVEELRQGYEIVVEDGVAELLESGDG